MADVNVIAARSSEGTHGSKSVGFCHGKHWFCTILAYSEKDQKLQTHCSLGVHFIVSAEDLSNIISPHSWDIR